MKYLSALGIELANIREYYHDWIAGIVAYPFQLAALWLVWVTLFRVSATGSLGEYTTGGIVAYYFGVIVLGRVVGTAAGVENGVWQDIIRGGLDLYMVRPISYPGFLAARILGRACMTMLFGVPVLLAYLLLSGHRVAVHHLLAFVAMALCGVTIYFLVWFLFGMLTFKMVRIFGVRDVVWSIVALFSGATIPLDLLPGVLQRIAVFLPLKYIYFDPLAMLMGRRTGPEILTGFVIMLAWVVFLIITVAVLWRRGVKTYESAGG